MATEQLTDQEKEFRRRARRRLIGAVALVLLMVTVLPMLLDDRSDQNTPAADVAISIPSQDDGKFPSKIVPVAPAPAAPAVADTAPAPVSPAPEEAPAVSEKAPPIKLDSPLAPAKADKPVVEKAAPEKAMPEKAAEAPAAVKKGMVSVQVGVFSDPVKVKQVQAKIAALGLQFSTETLNTPSGPKLRMRSGPYATRDEAEKALESLKGAGFSPLLVTH